MGNLEILAYTIGLVIICTLQTIGAESDTDAVLGTWYTEKCQARFEFYRVGNEYCAKLYPLEKPEMLDKNNPVDSLKNRKLKGATTIYGLAYNQKKQQWSGGKVYNPEDGRTYGCSGKLKKGKLYFRGFLGVSLLGGNQVWTRECR